MARSSVCQNMANAWKEAFISVAGCHDDIVWKILIVTLLFGLQLISSALTIELQRTVWVVFIANYFRGSSDTVTCWSCVVNVRLDCFVLRFIVISQVLCIRNKSVCYIHTCLRCRTFQQFTCTFLWTCIAPFYIKRHLQPFQVTVLFKWNRYFPFHFTLAIRALFLLNPFNPSFI